MKLIDYVKAASSISIFPRKRKLIEPITFTHNANDAAAMQSDFLKVGQDMQMAMERYGRQQQLPHH